MGRRQPTRRHNEFALRLSAEKRRALQRARDGDGELRHRAAAQRAVVALLFVVLAASNASAQFDFAGSWAPIGTEDVQNDSLPVDYLGLALTDEARTRALSYDESQKSMMERQCAGWGAAYMVLGPFGLRVTSQSDPVTNGVVSYTIGAWEDWNGMIIWMDGRARSSENAQHT